MYANPVLLPELSNREDLLRTISLFDDDTGEAIDLSGRTLAAPGDFAGNNWTVTSGAIVTASVTQLTIKDYPIGNEMQALPLTVGQNLGILAGDPVTIADATGLNTMTGYVISYAPATGALVCQIGCAFEFEIRAHQGQHDSGFGSSSSDMGSGWGDYPEISAQLGNGLSVVDVGVVQVRIPASTIAKLRHRTYGVGMTMFDGADTRQLFIGKLPIINGGVATMPLPAPPSANPYGLP